MYLTKPQFDNVTVIMGGSSSEREISIATGKACAQALRRIGCKVDVIDIKENPLRQLIDIKTDAIFNALHGTNGEDGRIQAALELLKIPYTHSGVLSSALAFNKVKAKNIMAQAQIPIAQHIELKRPQIIKKHPMKIPYVIKPIADGSSIGVFIITDEKQLDWYQKIIDNPQWGDEWMVEPYIAGKELTCGVMDDKPLDVIDIVTEKGIFYDYRAKYQKGASKHIIPAQISPDIYQYVQKMALKAHKAIGCKGVSRVDFRFDHNKNENGLVCMEINTQAGMTQTSLIPDMAKYKKIDFEQLVSYIINDASIER